MECPICCLSFTQIKRKCITCLHCTRNACMQCWETYLPTVAVQQPKCMHCDVPWSDEFISLNFTRSFREGPMKRAREDRLLAVEEAMLPGTQEYAQIARRMDLKIETKKKLMEELRTSTADNVKSKSKRSHLRLNAEKYTENPEAYTNEMCLKKQIHWISKDIQELKRSIYENPIQNDQGKNIERKPKVLGFLHKCPAVTCTGFLDGNHMCGMCRTTMCSDCLEPKESGHVCNPDSVASVKAMKRDSKPCPSCGMGISKIDGCDQMWCTECKTAFSWITGRIETGVIHNPHWYEWQRLQQGNNGGNANPRAPNPRARGCWGDRPAYPNYITLHDARYKYSDTVHMAHRCLTHLSVVTLPGLQPPRIDEKTNIDLRIDYLLGKLEKNDWKQRLCTRAKKRDLDGSLRQILDTFITVAGEILWKYCEEVSESFPNVRAKSELHAIRKYTNDSMRELLARHGSKRTFEITDAFEVSN